MKYTISGRPALYESSARLLDERGIDYLGHQKGHPRLKSDVVFVHTLPFTGAGFGNLKWVVSNTTDTSHINVCEGVEVVSLQELDLRDVHSVAEHAIYLAMSMLKRSRTRSGEPNGDMRGVKYDILGNGRVAGQIEVMLEAFDAKGVFRSSDPIILFVALPATEGNRHAVNYEVLDELTPGSIVVNISRGSVIDESAMVRAIDRGICYATDFPLKLHNVRESRLGQYIATHHVGGYTHQGLEKTEALVVDELLKRIDQKAALVSN